MKAKKATKIVRIDKGVVSKVEKHKSVTGVPVGKFFELAAVEKLKNVNK